jgi:DNA integrity scanning protein DisA with diadenylate cyclase activity
LKKFPEYVEIFAKRTVRKYDWLIDLSRRHSISIFILEAITNFLDEALSLEKEEEQPAVGLVIANPSLELAAAPLSVARFFLREAKRFADLKSAADGKNMVYVVGEDGLVGVHSIPSDLVRSTADDTLKELSSRYGTLCFCVSAHEIKVYSEGHLTRLKRKGTWLRPCEMKFERLERDGYGRELLQKILFLCMNLSERAKGALFIIQRGDELRHCQPTMQLSFAKTPISSLPDDQIVKLAELDGAVIVSQDGFVLGVNQQLTPPHAKFDRIAGGGTRHNTASQYSAACDCIAYVVSQDGPISLFYQGNVLARCFEELTEPK